MIITRTPFRISFAGGGSDIESFYSLEAGAVLSTAINKYIAAYGGLQLIRFQPDGSVFVDPVICRSETKMELNRRLIMFYTGRTRSAGEVLTRQRGNGRQADPLRKMCEIAYQLRDVLTMGRDLNAFGELLHKAWEIKKSLESTISNPRIDDYYERALRAGAVGG